MTLSAAARGYVNAMLALLTESPPMLADAVAASNRLTTDAVNVVFDSVAPTPAPASSTGRTDVDAKLTSGSAMAVGSTTR